MEGLQSSTAHLRNGWHTRNSLTNTSLIANGVDDAGKHACREQLSGCGARTYKLIKCLIAPEKPTEKTFKKLVEIVLKYFDPVPAITVQRYKLNVRMLLSELRGYWRQSATLETAWRICCTTELSSE